MKVLLINGSPKMERSNSLKLTRAFLEGWSKVDELEVEEVVVEKMEIMSCQGCLNCWKRTPGKCMFKDEMSACIDKYMAADVLIWSFPLYFYSLPGKLKMFLDRTCCTNRPVIADRTDGIGNGTHASRYDKAHQRNILISTCGHVSDKGNYKAVEDQFDLCLGFRNYTTLFCGQGEMLALPFLKDRADVYLGYVREAGEDYGRYGVILPKTREKLDELIMPKEEFEKQANGYYAHMEKKAAERAAAAAAEAAAKEVQG